MKPVHGLFWVKEWRLLKIVPMGIKAGIPLAHQVMDPFCTLGCCWIHCTTAAMCWHAAWWHLSWACWDAFSWWCMKVLEDFTVALCWRWCQGLWTKEINGPVWTLSAPWLPFYNCVTLPVCCNAPVLLHSLFFSADVSCTQPCDHLQPVVFANSAANGFHLNNLHTYSEVALYRTTELLTRREDSFNLYTHSWHIWNSVTVWF
jgi:hypothetical protein